MYMELVHFDLLDPVIPSSLSSSLQCTQVTEFARDAYSRTGHSLLDSIAIVHPFILTTLMQRVEGAVEQVGEVRGGLSVTMMHWKLNTSLSFSLFLLSLSLSLLSLFSLSLFSLSLFSLSLLPSLSLPLSLSLSLSLPLAQQTLH